MVAGPRAEQEPDLEAVLGALDDEDCRELVRCLDDSDPMTASELSEQTGVPQSTTYRKLDLLTEATLLDELTEIRRDGRHTTRFQIDFDEVVVGHENSEFTLQIDRPARPPEERIAALWSEVRKET